MIRAPDNPPPQRYHRRAGHSCASTMVSLDATSSPNWRRPRACAPGRTCAGHHAGNPARVIDALIRHLDGEPVRRGTLATARLDIITGCTSARSRRGHARCDAHAREPAGTVHRGSSRPVAPQRLHSLEPAENSTRSSISLFRRRRSRRCADGRIAERIATTVAVRYGGTTRADSCRSSCARSIRAAPRPASR